MKKKQAQEESGGEKAPLWIISFADMISLLMAFFVMLQTLATEHTNELFTSGRGKFVATMGEFKRHVSGFGIPNLLGSSPERLYSSVPGREYHLDSPDSQPVLNPSVDSEGEKLRRLFTKLSQSAKTDLPQLRGKIHHYTFLPIQFSSADESQFDSDTILRLTQQVAVLEQTGIEDESVVYYVVGQARDVSPPSEQWMVSEKRAKSVAEFLRSVMPESLRDNIHWWGAGAGGEWFASANIEQAQNYVLIVRLASSPR